MLNDMSRRPRRTASAQPEASNATSTSVSGGSLTRAIARYEFPVKDNPIANFRLRLRRSKKEK
jgi:hypothetical protein